MMLKTAIAVLVVHAVVCAPLASGQASFQGLGDLPGGGFLSWAKGISADGAVVVGMSESEPWTEAFRWTAVGGMEPLSDLPGEEFASGAYDVSGDGSLIIGESGTSSFRWTTTGGMERLFSAGDGYCIARGISADGLVVVGIRQDAWEGFRWTEAEGVQGLGFLSDNDPRSEANAASANGEVIVGVSVSNSLTFEAVRWTAGGIEGLGESTTEAYAVSADGSVVVGVNVINGGRQEAFRWTEAEGAQGLGYLGGDHIGRAYGVSADGAVVVGAAANSTGAEAFVWTAEAGMRSVEDILTSECGLDLTGWALKEATGVSDDGMTIVGYGRNPDGHNEAWIATIPEPATLSLLALGALATVRRRRLAMALVVTIPLAGMVFTPSAAHAGVFNMGPGLTSLETVHVGNLGNEADSDTGYGAVAYEYNIGKYEVTASQYTEFLNAVAKTDTYALYTDRWLNDSGCKIQRSGSPGSYTYSVADDWANRPVNCVPWGNAARFANWLHNGQQTGMQDLNTTEDGAYDLSATQQYYGPGGELPAFGSPERDALDAAVMMVVRLPGARWAIPTEDEWYKAAYHKNDGDTGNYFVYPTSSDQVPGRDMSEVANTGNNANYWTDGYLLGPPYYRTEVGEFEFSDSPYGTFDQGGNLWEWNEAIVNGARVTRGASASIIEPYLSKGRRTALGSTELNYGWGFRVVQIPEPATLALLALGGMVLLRRERE